jgi:hypothetical protein
MATSAMAAADWRAMSLACLERTTDAEIAECLRKGKEAQFVVEEAENRKKRADKQETIESPRLLVRESASSISNFGARGFGEKGGSLTALRDKGVDSTLAKVAVFAVFDPLFGGRAQPFVGLGWARDGSVNPKTDIRQLTTGTAGPLFQTRGDGWQAFTLFHTLQVSRRSDRYATTSGTTARAHFDLALGELASGELLGFPMLPHVAALWQHRTKGTTERGDWQSYYAGMQMEKSALFGFPRLKISAVARTLFDTKVPAGNAERRQRYLNVSLDYYLYDPEDKTAALQPSLFIMREKGTDFLEFGKAVNKTTAGVRLKFN